MIAMHRPSSGGGELLHRAIIGMQPLLSSRALLLATEAAPPSQRPPQKPTLKRPLLMNGRLLEYHRHSPRAAAGAGPAGAARRPWRCDP